MRENNRIHGLKVISEIKRPTFNYGINSFYFSVPEVMVIVCNSRCITLHSLSFLSRREIPIPGPGHRDKVESDPIFSRERTFQPCVRAYVHVGRGWGRGVYFNRVRREDLSTVLLFSLFISRDHPRPYYRRGEESGFPLGRYRIEYFRRTGTTVGINCRYRFRVSTDSVY